MTTAYDAVCLRNQRLQAELREVRAERDALREAIGRVEELWDRETAQGFPFLHRSAVVPELRAVLAQHPYRTEATDA